MQKCRTCSREPRVIFCLWKYYHMLQNCVSVVLTCLALSSYCLYLQLYPATCSILVFLTLALLSLSYSVCIFHTTLAVFLLTIRAMVNCVYKGFLSCGKCFSECAVLHHLALKGCCFPWPLVDFFLNDSGNCISSLGSHIFLSHLGKIQPFLTLSQWNHISRAPCFLWLNHTSSFSGFLFHPCPK